MRWTPSLLAEVTQGKLIKESSRPIEAVFLDSRAPVAHGIFVPIVAARDGHDFIAEAIHQGATAVLQERGRPIPRGEVTVVEVDHTFEALQALARYARKQCQGPVVSITGSNGKTTTRAMVEAIFRKAWPRVCATQGNLNNHLGLPLTLVNGPDAPQAMVLELGMSQLGEVDRLAAIAQPNIAVITNIACEHLEFMGSLQAIAQAEAEVVAHLNANDILIIPMDEPLLEAQIPSVKHLQAIRIGKDESKVPIAVRIVDVQVDESTKVHLHVRRKSGQQADMHLRLRLFGKHHAFNAAAAVAVGLWLDLPNEWMVTALEEVEAVGHRGKVISWGQQLVIADCYNANPGSMASALRSLAALRSSRLGPLVAVLGDMLELGPTEQQLHQEIGQLIADLKLDAVFAVGPRAVWIAETARQSGVQAIFMGEKLSECKAALLEHLQKYKYQAPGAILLKASHGVGLGKLVEEFLLYDKICDYE